MVSRPVSPNAETAVFVDAARQFCAFVENASSYSLEARLIAARERLLELYSAGSKLPDIERPDGIEAGPSSERPTKWPGFERFDSYREIFEPYVEGEPVAASLSDDLLDVYGDLQRGLVLWDKGGATDNDAFRLAAIWEWRFGFEIHWGDHAIDALRALHRACKPG